MREKEKIGSLCVVIRKPNVLTLKLNTSELALFLSRLSFSPNPTSDKRNTESKPGGTDETQTVFAMGQKYCEQRKDR